MHYSSKGVPKEGHMASAPAGHKVHKTHEATHASRPQGHGKVQHYATGKHPFHSGTGPGRGK